MVSKKVNIATSIYTFMLLSGCASNVISIDAKDSVTFSTLETLIPLSEEHTAGIKLRGSRASGDYSQAVPDDKMIIIEDTQIHGPTDVSGSVDLGYASVSIGGEDILPRDEQIPQEFSFLGYIGIAQTRMDATLLHQGTTYTTKDRTTELFLQMGATYAISPSFNAGITWSSSIGTDLTGITELDFRLNYLLSTHLEVIGGYRRLEYNYLVVDDDSTIRVKFKGPFIGLNIPF